MSTILSTVEGYEDQVLEFVKTPRARSSSTSPRASSSSVTACRPSPTPTSLPTPIEVVESQVAFAKKLIDANTAIVTAVLETVAPVAGYAKPKKVVKAAKAA